MEEKKLIWQKYFNNCEFAFDFAGRKIKYSDYENEDSELAWSIYRFYEIQKFKWSQ